MPNLCARWGRAVSSLRINVAVELVLRDSVVDSTGRATYDRGAHRRWWKHDLSGRSADGGMAAREVENHFDVAFKKKE